MNNGDFNSKSFTSVDELDQTIWVNKFESNDSHKPLTQTCQTQVLCMGNIIKQ